MTNTKILAALGDLAKPLDGSEIDTLTISNSCPEAKPLTIHANERSRFIGRRGQTKIIEEGIFDGYYYIETLSYATDGKWKLVKKDSPKEVVSGIIIDTDFLIRVSNNAERFAKDDILVASGVWYKEKTKLTGKTKTTYIIKKVKDHIPAGDHQWQLR